MNLLQIVINDTIKQSQVLSKSALKTNNIWIYVAIGELIIIFLLFSYIRIFRKKQTFTSFERTILEARDGVINMDNLMLNINKSKELYKELSRICHPDKHSNSQFQKEIDCLFQEISENKRNYSRLLELKEKAITIYKIKFD